MIDLMTPRYEVIAPVPFSKFKVGDILHLQSHDIFGMDYKWYSAERFSQAINARDIDKYPHLFRKMGWWEQRDISEMPKYVKNIFNKEVFKITTWDIPDDGEPSCVLYEVYYYSRVTIYATDNIPATEQDYIDYINQNSKSDKAEDR